MCNFFENNGRPDLSIGSVVKHFKRNFLTEDELKKPETKNMYLYKILNIAEHTETKEKLVIYQAMSGDYKIYARPLKMFLSKVDTNKYPNSKQKYRFELVKKY